ncbi:MAG: hypothetical protein GX958_00880 [Desulfitobacterium sp.]|nr:hypothetical protein [Desulfitobacterium sp.]
MDLFSEFINIAESKLETQGIWKEEPVDLMTFFTSPDFLGEKPYPGKQTELVEIVNSIVQYKIIGNEEACPKELREVTELCTLFGKGSGKDFLASAILTYMCYVILCLNDPHGYFGFGKDTPIDLINMAINAYQANNVFFSEFKAKLTNCKWFKRVSYNPSQTPHATHRDFQLTKNQVRFYKNITAHSAHSEADSYEGFNPLVVIFDEIDGFDPDAAERAYTTLRSSAVTRFNDKVLLIFISFPRQSDGFMIKKYEDSKTNPQVYGIKGKSWEVNPSMKRESLQMEYDRDPEKAKMLYECEPPLYSQGLFTFPEKIDEVIMLGKKAQNNSLIIQESISTRTLANGEERHFIGLELHNLVLDPSFTYYIGGDGGVRSDSYVICLMHAEPTLIEIVENGEKVQKWINKPVEDLLLEWQPSKKDRLPVDLLNVADILEQICQQVHVRKAMFDKFNSAEVVQRLMTYGVEAEDKNFSNPFQVQIYQNLKGLVYTGNIALLDHEVYNDLGENRQNANEELKAIKLINGNKIDHDRDKAKDYSDARASAAWICSMDDPEQTEHYAMPLIFGAGGRR